MKINKQSVRALVATPHSVAIPVLEKALGDRDPDLRHAAADALQARGDAGFFALLRAAAHGNRLQRQEAVTCLGNLRDVRALQPLLASLQNDRRERNSRTIGHFLLAAIITCFAVQAAAPLWAETFRADADLQICVARALGNLGDVRALLPLIRLTRESHFGVRAAARDALLQLLPIAAQLPPDQVRGLGANAIPELGALLSDHDEPLVRQTLTVLFAIGDRQAIPAVERLANSPGRPYLHQEARRLLAVLEERTAHEQLRTTLLRGSRVPSASSGAQLLRPVDPAHEPDVTPSQLLRPLGEDPENHKI